MKTITWAIGGLEIPGLGISKEGQSIEIDDEIAKSLIDQGIAKLKIEKMRKKEMNITDKGGN